jgi:uncharacterized peroxidase-related enzyme
MMDLAQSLLFTDGYLIRRHKEMIATLISSQNSCPYCADSHGYFLRVHGGSAEALHAIQQNDLGSLSLTVAEQGLLRFAEKVNRNSHTISREDVDLALQTGWSEEQLTEAVHVAALFAAFNRVANAFGLPAHGLLALYEMGGNLDQSDSPNKKECLMAVTQETSSLFLPDVENHPQPSPYFDLIAAAKASGSEYWQLESPRLPAESCRAPRPLLARNHA